MVLISMVGVVGGLVGGWAGGRVGRAGVMLITSPSTSPHEKGGVVAPTPSDSLLTSTQTLASSHAARGQA